MSTIGIVGHGYVGKAVEFGFKPKDKILIHDKYLPSLSLPKDVVALLGLAREMEILMELLDAVWEKNLRIREVRDWEEIPGAVSS